MDSMQHGAFSALCHALPASGVIGYHPIGSYTKVSVHLLAISSYCRYKEDCSKLCDFVQRVEVVLKATTATADVEDPGWQAALQVGSTVTAGGSTFRRYIGSACQCPKQYLKHTPCRVNSTLSSTGSAELVLATE